MKATRIVSSVVCVFLYATLIRSNTYRAFADTSNIACSGECGENAVWELDKNGTLTISGFGAMYDYPCIYLEIETYNRNAALSGVFGGEKYDPVYVSSIIVKNGITEVDNFFRLPTSEQGVSIELSDSVKIIGSSAFADLNITSINLPKNLEVIGGSAFNSCNLIQSIVLPESVRSIGADAFQYCKNLKSIKLSDNLEIISSGAFSGTGIQNIVIPPSVKSIEKGAFAWCPSPTVTVLNSRCSLNSIFSFGIEVIYSDASATVVGYDSSTAYEFAGLSPRITFESIGKDYTLGDITCDGEVGLKDAVLLAKAISGNYQLTAEQKLQADIDWDHKVNDADLTYLLKRLAGDEDW